MKEFYRNGNKYIKPIFDFTKIENNPSYRNFVDTLHCTATMKKYREHLANYMKFRNYDDPTDLLKGDSKILETCLMEYLKKEKQRNISFSYLHQKYLAIKKFYIENDIENLRWHKIFKILGQQTKINRDRAYKHNEIRELLKFADHRIRLAILILSSTGMRVGGLTNLILDDLTYYRNENIYQFRVYTNTKEEYITFCTPECANALKEYLDYRKSQGEILTAESPVFRSHFDKRYKNTNLSSNTLGNEMSTLLNRSNIIKSEHRTESKRIIRKPIMRLHGFRKFFTTICIESNVNAEAREVMLGHTIGITQHYYRPTPRQLLDEYLKAVDNLTIKEENRLKDKNKHLENQLEEQNERYIRVEEQLQELKDLFHNKGLI